MKYTCIYPSYLKISQSRCLTCVGTYSDWGEIKDVATCEIYRGYNNQTTTACSVPTREAIKHTSHFIFRASLASSILNHGSWFGCCSGILPRHHTSSSYKLECQTRRPRRWLNLINTARRQMMMWSADLGSDSIVYGHEYNDIDKRKRSDLYGYSVIHTDNAGSARDVKRPDRAGDSIFYGQIGGPGDFKKRDDLGGHSIFYGHSSNNEDLQKCVNFGGGSIVYGHSKSGEDLTKCSDLGSDSIVYCHTKSDEDLTKCAELDGG